MHTVLEIAMGVGLAAACGFRVFVPLLVTGSAARLGMLTLSPGFEWLAETPALVVFATATALEIAAYYVPWLDHALDAVASPVAVVAGVVVAASVMTGMDPWLRWTLALIAGGGAAGAVQGATAATRAVSTWTTAGLGNPLVATLELAGSAILAILAIALPVLAAIVAVGLAVAGGRRLLAARRRG